MKKYILNLLFLSLGVLVFSPVSAFAFENLTITKVCSPSSCTSSDSFPFTVSDSNGIIGGSYNLDNTNNFTKSFPYFQNSQMNLLSQPTNVYTITENTPSGWNAPSINCGGANIGFNTSTPNSVTFDYTPTPMVPLAQIVCTFTNTKQTTVIDLCSNIVGAQSTIPTGYTFNAASGQCDQITTVTDLCSNVAGNQSTIPTGYAQPNAMTPGICGCAAGYVLSTATAASPAQCVPVTATDMCPNIVGAQSTIPTGYTFNAASGQCDQITTVTDMCVNIVGAQSTIPTGYVSDAAGNCTQTTVTPSTSFPDGCSSAIGFSTTTGTPCTSGNTILTGGNAGGPGGMAPGGLPTISGGANTFVFLKDLKVGSKGPDVAALQKLLEANGFLKMPKGNAYGYFGVSTRSALIKWQLKNGITPSGSFGPQSRRKIGYKGTVTLLKGMAAGTGNNPTTQMAYQDCYIGTPGYSDYNPNGCVTLVIYKKVPGFSTQAFNFDLSFNGDDGTFYGNKNFTLDDDGSNSNNYSNTVSIHVYPGLQYFLHETPASSFTTKVYKSIPSSLVNLVAQTTQIPTYNFTTPAGGTTSSVTFVNTKKITLPTTATLGTSLSAANKVNEPNNTTITGVSVGPNVSVVGKLTDDTGLNTGTNTTTGGSTVTNTTGTPQGLEGTVVGAGGKILYSNNQGLTWVNKLSGVTSDLKGVSFFDKYNGIAVGNSGVITKSTDDGITWSTQTSGTTQNLNAVSYFGTSSIAVAVGDNGKIIRTTNGGANWTDQTSPTTNKLNGVSFFGANGVAVGDGGKIISSSNGGTLWTVRTSNTTANLYGVYMSGPLTGIAVGANGIIVRTIDGGVTWSFEISGTIKNLNAVFSGTPNMTTAVGDNGTIITSVNQTIVSPTWVLQTNAPVTSSFGSQDFRGVSYYKSTSNINTGVVVSIHNTTARTVNNGVLWSDITNPYSSTTVSTQFNGVDLH